MEVVGASAEVVEASMDLMETSRFLHLLPLASTPTSIDFDVLPQSFHVLA